MPGRKAATPPTAYRRAVLRLARRDQTAAELRRALEAWPARDVARRRKIKAAIQRVERAAR